MNLYASSFTIATVSLLLGVSAVSAQTPANATGICKDGTYSTAAAKDGACRGHKGVQTWYSAATSNSKASVQPSAAANPASLKPAAPAAPTPVPPPTAPAASVKPTPPMPPTAQAAPRPGISAERAKLATMQPAPGGGAGLVWLNGSSKVYHCFGSEFYGKTKTGAYVAEADAKAKGAHADHNKPCS